MRQPPEAELEAADKLLVALADHYEDSEDILDPIVPGHPIHTAVGNWRRSLPKESLAPEFSRLRALLWKSSKVNREESKPVAEDFAELLIRRYPSLADEENDESCIAAGQWFDRPPPPDSHFQHGPISGQMQQLVRWMASGDPRTLEKHNGQVSYYIMKDHGRLFSVWFFSPSKLQEAQQRQGAENA